MQLINLLIEAMSSQDQQINSLAGILYKKMFLDDARSDQISPADLEIMKNTVIQTLDFSHNQTVLKRKAEILSKIFNKLKKSEELLQLLVQWATNENPACRQFTMYLFEIVAECHLTPEQLTTYRQSFMTIFVKSLQDPAVNVRVAALKATISFLTSLDDTDIVMQFADVVPQILSTMVEALKENEDQGRLALESMIELTNNCPELWKKSAP